MDILSIASSAITGLAAISIWFAKDKIKKIESEHSETKKEVLKLKDNYLDRFEKVNSNINKSKIEILERFHNLELHLKNKK